MEKRFPKDFSVVPFVFFLAAIFVGCAVYFGYQLQMSHLEKSAAARVAQWPETGRAAARLMLERYGPPDRQDAQSMAWLRRAPWKRIVVREYPPASPLTEVVAYELTGEQAEAIRQFSRGVDPNIEADELAAHGDNENCDFAALNLADEVARGVRTPAEAARDYDRIIKLLASGRSSAYADGLLFAPRPPQR